MKNVNDNADPKMSQRDPSKEYNQLHPRSLASSGMELDAGCGDIETSPVNAAMGVDPIFDAPQLPPVHMGSRGSKGIGTTFTSETTNHNPPLVLPLMTEKSAAAAKRAAPRSAYKTNLEDK